MKSLNITIDGSLVYQFVQKAQKTAASLKNYLRYQNEINQLIGFLGYSPQKKTTIGQQIQLFN